MRETAQSPRCGVVRGGLGRAGADVPIRAGALFLSAATLIALSRIALGMHYPSDVLAGLAVGLGAAVLVTRAGAVWIERLVTSVSRVSDPLLRPVWERLRRLAPSRL